MSLAWMIIGFIVVLTPIVLVHELGHFLVAKWSNIRVEEFGLGLPPRAATLAEKNGTIYSLNWIPLGGFVRPAGEDDPNVKGGLAGASKKARFFVLIAGAGANFIMAILVFWISFMIGAPQFDETKTAILGVVPDAPAAEAGILEGDIILEVNGFAVGEESAIVSEQVSAAGANSIEMLLGRNGEEVAVTLTPRAIDRSGEMMIGITLGPPQLDTRDSYAPIPALGKAVSSVWEYMVLFARVPAMLFNGEMSPAEARPVSIVGISQIAGRATQMTAQHNDFFPLLSMIAFINLALGLTNLLPIPALDGGRIIFVIIEAIRGRRIEPEREGMVHMVGMLFLLGLMVLLIVQDIVNPIIPF